MADHASFVDARPAASRLPRTRPSRRGFERLFCLRVLATSPIRLLALDECVDVSEDDEDNVEAKVR
jgi:hypothetical protein